MTSKIRFSETKTARRLLPGFTLTEILVVMAVSILILIALYGTHLISVRSYQKNTAKSEITQNARIALERITRDLRQTERIVTQLPPNDTDPLNPPSSSIQFQDGHNTAKIQYIQYSLASGNLTRQIIHYSFASDPTRWVAWNEQDIYGNLPTESIDENVVKANKISSLKFYGTKLINIDLTVSDNVVPYSFSTKVLGRNIQ